MDLYGVLMDFLWICSMVTVSYGAAGNHKGALNNWCRTIGDCREYGYYCAGNRTCQCLPNYIPNDKWNRCLGLLGEKCKYDEHCIEGAFCYLQDVCKCKDDFVPSFDNMYCSSGGSTKKLNYSFTSVLLLVWFYIKVS